MMIQILELWRDGSRHKGERSYWFTLSRPGDELSKRHDDVEHGVLVQAEFEDGAVHEQTFADDQRAVAELAEMLTR